MAERLNIPENSPEKGNEELDATRNERKAEIERNLEKSVEQSKDKDVEQLKESAEKAAEVKKKPTAASKAEKKRDTPAQRRSKAKASYKKTMKETQSQMKPAERTFSKVIHNPAVEKTSEAVGSTVARPNAILAGSVSAFLFTVVIYLFARHYGYPLKGSETIAAFVLGWTVGLLFDYLRVMITGKRA
jgi:FtsZ-interacting cell division protein ZipA